MNKNEVNVLLQTFGQLTKRKFIEIYFVMDSLSVSALKVILHQVIGIDGRKSQLWDQR